MTMGTGDPTTTLMAVFEAIPNQLNPYADTAIQHLDRWVAEQGVIIASAAKDRFEQANFSWFAAAAYPTANETDLALITDWFVWFFLLDDQLDDGRLGKNPERINTLMTMIFDVLDGPEDRGHGPATPTIVTSLADLWQRTAVSASSAWRRRFIDHMIAGGMAACWEADNRVRGVVPDAATYVQKRRHTGAIYVFMDLIEIVEHIDLPAEIYGREPFAGALRAACDVVAWTNDLYSLDKEASMGEYHNLVAIIQHERALSRVDAIKSVTRLISERVQDFFREELAVHAAWPTNSVEVSGYLAGMRSFMRGNLDWSATTRRYRDTRRHSPDPTRYLEAGVVEQTGQWETR
ncbi:MAG: terpene synthase family protein [Pseudonocardia sp.]